MPRLCLMYHHTPPGPAETPWDVPLDLFKDSIERMLDSGVHFRPLLEGGAGPGPADQVEVSITFDDGHGTNAEAIDYLHSKNIRASLFIVRDWSQQRPEYLSGKSISDMAGACDFGGHGASHTGMTFLSDRELEQELRDSKAYVEALIDRPVTSMALPGGMGDRRVLHAARQAGFSTICNSVEDLNFASGPVVNRVCIKASDDSRAPLSYVQAPSSYWRKRRLRRAAISMSTAVLGQAGYSRLAKLAKTIAKS